jgi:hypothetical protein
VRYFVRFFATVNDVMSHQAAILDQARRRLLDYFLFRFALSPRWIGAFLAGSAGGGSSSVGAFGLWGKSSGWPSPQSVAFSLGLPFFFAFFAMP